MFVVECETNSALFGISGSPLRLVIDASAFGSVTVSCLSLLLISAVPLLMFMVPRICGSVVTLVVSVGSRLLCGPKPFGVMVMLLVNDVVIEVLIDVFSELMMMVVSVIIITLMASVDVVLSARCGLWCTFLRAIAFVSPCRGWFVSVVSVFVIFLLRGSVLVSRSAVIGVTRFVCSAGFNSVVSVISTLMVSETTIVVGVSTSLLVGSVLLNALNIVFSVVAMLSLFIMLSIEVFSLMSAVLVASSCAICLCVVLSVCSSADSRVRCAVTIESVLWMLNALISRVMFANTSRNICIVVTKLLLSLSWLFAFVCASVSVCMLAGRTARMRFTSLFCDTLVAARTRIVLSWLRWCSSSSCACGVLSAVYVFELNLFLEPNVVTLTIRTGAGEGVRSIVWSPSWRFVLWLMIVFLVVCGVWFCMIW